MLIIQACCLDQIQIGLLKSELSYHGLGCHDNKVFIARRTAGGHALTGRNLEAIFVLSSEVKYMPHMAAAQEFTRVI